MAEQSLSGLRVLDLTQGVAGPVCGKLLAGMGAEVIKIEPPGEGDVARSEGPFLHDEPNAETSGLFLFLNTDKKGVSLDIGQAEGRRILLRLVETADVVVESFPPGTLQSLGLSYGALSSVNPAVVLTSITPFGQTGPYAPLPATHLTLDAMAGLTYLRGEIDKPPVYSGGHILEYSGGLVGLVGTLTALAERDFSGLGQQVDVSTFEALLHYNECFLLHYPWQGLILNRHYWPASGTRFLPCRDGWILVRTVLGRFDDLLWFVNRPELFDERFQTAAGRAKYAKEYDAIIRSWLADHDRKQLFQEAQERRLPFGYVATCEDLLSDPQNVAREFFVELEHPAAGKVKYPGAPFKLSETPWRTTKAAPLLGQHTDEVLGDLLGYEPEDLARLRHEGVI